MDSSSVASYGSQLATAQDGGSSSITNSSSEATTIAITNALKFATAKSVRTSTIILASFNALAAFATAVGIIHGCRTYRKTVRRLQQQRKLTTEPPSGLFFISAVEVFPLVLCLSITIQSIIFAAAQSIGLQALLSRGCSLVAIAVLPAVLIVPITHFVFGLETALRGLRSQFAPRGKWTVSICLGLLTALTLAAVVVAAVSRSPDFCFASLFWFVRRYAQGCFVVLTIIGVALLAAIGVIFFKLNRSHHLVDPSERTSATRMIYYLCLGFLSNAFILPFFFSLTFLDQQKYIWETLNLSMVAAVVANVNGLMVAGLHLFLNAQANAKLRQNFEEYEHKQFYTDEPRSGGGAGPGRSSLRRSSLSLQLINSSYPHYYQHQQHQHQQQQQRGRSGSNATLLRTSATAADYDARSPQSATSYGTTSRPPFSPKLSIPSTNSGGPKYPEPTQPPSEVSPSQLRKQSYSIFPPPPLTTTTTSTTATTTPTTTTTAATSTTTPTAYKPPPIVKPWVTRGGHRRDSSVGSTATVQIGIRISNVNDFVPRKSTDTTTTSPVDDIMIPPVPTMTATPQQLRNNDHDDVRSVSEYDDDDDEIVLANPPPPRNRSAGDARMKTLPPVPKSPAAPVATAVEPAAADQQLITLSPAVYTPQGSSAGSIKQTSPTKSSSVQRSLSNRSDRGGVILGGGGSGKKIPSPMGVGFNSPQTAAVARSPVHNALLLLHAPPRPGGSAASTPLPGTKADWI